METLYQEWGGVEEGSTKEGGKEKRIGTKARRQKIRMFARKKDNAKGLPLIRSVSASSLSSKLFLLAS